MKKLVIAGGLVAAMLVLGRGGALADPWADGMAAYNRGDYVPAMELFRPLARPAELAQAREMMQACEASDYRNCEY